MEQVLLTGVSGFIAKHIALKLLNAGYSVRGTLRRMDRADEVRAALAPYLTEQAGELSFVQADLESDAGWAEALKGVSALVHTASPFPIAQPKDPATVIRPAVEGTERVLKAAAALLQDGALEKARADRYAGWEKPESKALLAGSFEDAAAVVTAKGLNPEPKSGRQERLENLWNRFI